jgi:hypothetical protein
MIANRSAVATQDKLAVLDCRRLPGRLNTSEVAVILGFHDHDIPILVAAKSLTPLGKPAHNSPKYFATVEVLARADDCEWLSDATRTIAKYWRRKNNAHGRIPKSYSAA